MLLEGALGTKREISCERSTWNPLTSRLRALTAQRNLPTATTTTIAADSALVAVVSEIVEA